MRRGAALVTVVALLVAVAPGPVASADPHPMVALPPDRRQSKEVDLSPDAPRSVELLGLYGLGAALLLGMSGAAVVGWRRRPRS